MSKKKNQVTRREALRLMGAAGATALVAGSVNSALSKLICAGRSNQHESGDGCVI
ncbi:MAG: hypothetical protein ACKVZH_14415 [Blastocatellia bacterium]